MINNPTSGTDSWWNWSESETRINIARYNEKDLNGLFAQVANAGDKVK